MSSTSNARIQASDPALQKIADFFQLQGCCHLVRQILRDSGHRQYLAVIGEAALRLYIVKQLALCGVKGSGYLQRSSEHYLTNARLALLDKEFHFTTAMGRDHLKIPTACTQKAVAGVVEALLGAGELSLGGRYTQAAVLKIMHFLDTYGAVC